LPGYLRRAVSSCVTAILALGIIYALFAVGVERGFDHVLPWGPEAELNDITIAISDAHCHLNAGYVGYSAVKSQLTNYIEPFGPNSPKTLPDLNNEKLLNTALSAAAAVPCPAADFGHVDDGTLISSVNDDIGFTDYAKLAFRAFGTRIEALYYLYFALLVASVLIFIAEFGGSLVASVMLLATLFSFLLEAHSGIFGAGMPSYFGLRHTSVLAIIPMWHFALLLILGRRLAPTRCLLAFAQLALLLLSMSMRGSTRWIVLFICALSLGLALAQWLRKPPAERTPKRLVVQVLRWPLVVLLGGVFVYGTYISTILNPIYFTDDAMPYHGAWHSAYVGYAMSPDSVALGGPKPGDALDSQGMYADVAYSKEHHFLSGYPSYISPWTRSEKLRLHDNMMRRVVTDMWRKHPVGTLLLYIYYKPMALASAYMAVALTIPRAIWLWALSTLSLFWLFWIFTVRTESAEDAARQMATLFMWGAAASFVCSAPYIWAYPSGGAFDFFLVGTATLLLASLTIITKIFVRFGLARLRGAG
jgi:hypothetical protein